jgi:two-component sensor histidine kinase
MSFAAEIECDRDELPGLRAELDEWLAEQDVSPQTAFQVKFVAHEAAKNAIDHADPCDHVHVMASVAKDVVVVRVADTNAEPWELHPANDDEARGLALIGALAKRVDVMPLRRGTALVAAIGRSSATYPLPHA